MNPMLTDDLPSCLCGSREYAAGFRGDRFRLLACVRCGLSRIHPKPAMNAGLAADAGAPERDTAMETLWGRFAAKILDQAAPFKKGGRLLDVGCGNGVLLKCARDRGFEVAGIELNPKRAEYGRRFLGLDIRAEDFSKSDIRGIYDVVVSNHLIEHLDDPLALLAGMKRAAKDDGIVIVGTPNVDGWIRMLLGRKWSPYCPEDHIFLFNPGTLSRLAAQAGLRTIRTAITHNHYGGKAAVLAPLLFLFDVLGAGDNMILVFQKG